MTTFESKHDIGDVVQVNGRTATVKALYIGTDRTISTVLEFATVDGKVTTYDTTTLPESAVPVAAQAEGA